jgi:hypothetical protein
MVPATPHGVPLLWMFSKTGKMISKGVPFCDFRE